MLGLGNATAGKHGENGKPFPLERFVESKSKWV
jgi:hypothetical protein